MTLHTPYMISKKESFREFNRIYFEFLNFLKKYSNNNRWFSTFYQKNYVVKRANIKLLIRTWYEHIALPHNDKILNENDDFFLQYDFYSESKIISTKIKGGLSEFDRSITFMKQKYQELDQDTKDLFKQYMKKLTYLSMIYYKSS